MNESVPTATAAPALPEVQKRVGARPVPWQRVGRVAADLRVGGRYVPAGPEPVAGDFYEVLPLGPDLVALMVGDVAGHGRSAAPRMRQLRTAARACAQAGGGPAQVLAQLESFMVGLQTESLATFWYGEYHCGSGELRYASAGHPPPVVYVHGQPVRLLALADVPPLGTGLGHAPATEHVEHLPPGAVLVAYSDGLVERRGTDIDKRLGLLADLVAHVCDRDWIRTPAAIAAEVLHALVPDPDRADDDVCLLVVRPER